MPKAVKYLALMLIPLSLAVAFSFFVPFATAVYATVTCAIIMVLLLELARAFPSGSLIKTLFVTLELGILIFNVMLWPLFFFWHWYLKIPLFS